MVINGVTVAPGTDVPERTGYAYFFSDYALSSTSYVYNSAGGQGADDGLVPVSGADLKTIQYNIANPTGTVTVTIYARINGGADAIIASFTAVASTSGFINIVEKVDKIRVGVKISAGSAVVSVTGKMSGMEYSL